MRLFERGSELLQHEGLYSPVKKRLFLCATFNIRGSLEYSSRESEFMKVVSVVGARPQFIKASVVSPALAAEGITEYLIHTGQHYSRMMSEIFFEDLELPKPVVNLGIGSGAHGCQTGEMLRLLESSIQSYSPDLVLVYGDTNSTLAAALAAVKLNIPVAHVEAGPRNHSLSIPEEVNRVLTDRLSAILFCVTPENVENLGREGITKGVYLTGDVMLDLYRKYEATARNRFPGWAKLGLVERQYVLVTLHRPSNVDNPQTLLAILEGLAESEREVIFLVHPRTQRTLDRLLAQRRYSLTSQIRIVGPQSYLDTLCLELNCRCILTDSGGVQREAYFAKKPCLTIFQNTAWPETVSTGWNQPLSADSTEIASAIQNIHAPERHDDIFGDGFAASRIGKLLSESIQGGITVDGVPTRVDDVADR